MTKLLTLGILFSTVVIARVAAKLVILGISLLTSFILAFRVVLLAEVVIYSISSSIFLILALYNLFQWYNFFTSLSLLNQQ